MRYTTVADYRTESDSRVWLVIDMQPKPHRVIAHCGGWYAHDHADEIVAALNERHDSLMNKFAQNALAELQNEGQA